jgi:hypothetical protein
MLTFIYRWKSMDPAATMKHQQSWAQTAFFPGIRSWVVDTDGKVIIGSIGNRNILDGNWSTGANPCCLRFRTQLQVDFCKPFSHYNMIVGI